VDLAGRTALVTGANSGIGFEVARGLAALGARVILACRDPAAGARALDEIRTSTGDPTLELVEVDVSRRDSVRALARGLESRLERLDVLVNNAGLWAPKRRETADGVELTWGTNQLGYVLVARGLLPLLRAAPAARIVNVASQLARDLDLDDVEFRRRRYTGVAAYAQSKQANRMWTWALARRLEGTGVTANALHPGGVATPIFSKGGGLLSQLIDLIMRLRGRSPRLGADTALWLAASPDVEGVSARFFIDRKDVRCRFRNPEAEERLFELCESMTDGSASVVST
jgi:NAD(P)-dependent dehydrogenase (short-subunit alcohol dehydrogenase family)